MSGRPVVRRKSVCLPPSAAAARRASAVFGGSLLSASFPAIESDASTQQSSPSARKATPLRANNPSRMRTVLLTNEPCRTAGSMERSPSTDGGRVGSGTTQQRAFAVESMGALPGSPVVASVLLRGQRHRYDVDAVGSLTDALASEASGLSALIDEMADAFTNGNNIAALHLGTSRTPFVVPGGQRSDGGASTIVTGILGRVLSSMKHTQGSLHDVHTSSSIDVAPSSGQELLVSLFAFADGKVRDLAVPATLHGDGKSGAPVYHRAPIAAHVITGPKFVGLPYKAVHSIEDVERLVALAAASAGAEKKYPIIGASILLKQCTESSEDGEATDATLSSFMAMDFSDRFTAVSRLLDGNLTSDLTALLSGVIGGNCFTATFGSVDRDDEPSLVHQVLSLLHKAGAISSSGCRRGSVRAAVSELKDHIASLQERIDHLPGMDNQSRKRLEREIANKEHQYHELDEHLHRATEHVSLTNQVLRMTQLQQLNATETKQALHMLDNEKRKRFAQAFRMAFQKQQVSAVNAEHVQQLTQRLDHCEAELASARQAHAAMQEERDNIRAHSEAQSQELKLEYSQRHQLELMLSKNKRMCSDHEVHIVELEGELRKRRSVDSAATTHLTVALAAAKTELLETQSMLAKRTVELAEAHRVRDALQAERDRKDAEDAHARASRSTRSEIECAAMKDLLTFRDASIQQLEAKLQHTQELLVQLQKKFLDEVRINATLREDLHHRVRALRGKYSIEREAYQALLHEGQCYLDELRQLHELEIRAPSSAYRGGQQAVVAWHSALGSGLESLASTLFQQGFDTLHAVSMLQEEDLAKMHVTAGTRRKIMHAVRELEERYAGVLKNTVSLFRRPPPSIAVSDAAAGDDAISTLWPNAAINEHLSSSVSAVDLLNDLDAWISDFRASIDAEAEMSDAFLASTT